MKLSDLKKLCDEAPKAWDSRPEAWDFYEAARTYLPKLIAVAEAAELVRKYFEDDDDSMLEDAVRKDLTPALAALEADE